MNNRFIFIILAVVVVVVGIPTHRDAEVRGGCAIDAEVADRAGTPGIIDVDLLGVVSGMVALDGLTARAPAGLAQ